MSRSPVEMLSTFLNLSGHDPIGALSNSQTWDKLAYEEPDAILLDIMLPDGNGLEICKQLRANPKWAERTGHHHLGALATLCPLKRQQPARMVILPSLSNWIR